MITFLGNASDLDHRIDLQLEPHFDGTGDRHERLPRSVANPRRTIWTGFAKSDPDRLPAS